jgi:hypothetical protein
MVAPRSSLNALLGDRNQGERMKKWRNGLMLALVLAFTATVLAYSAHFGVGANIDNYVYSTASLSTAGSEGTPYVQTKVEGYTGWVGGNANAWACYPSWCASATAQTSTRAAGGTFTGVGEFFINNQFRERRSHTVSFTEPEPEEECIEPDYWDGDRCIPANCPILIPTGNSQAIRLTTPEAGVVFDLRGTGAPVQTAWPVEGSNVALLAMDRNGNGIIDSGKELFGDSTLPDVRNGFHALRLSGEHDGDGKLDATDPLFASLLLWTDRNHNGYSEPTELQPASDVLEAIGLGYVHGQRRDGFGNQFKYQGWARKPGNADETLREFRIFDVYFAVR